MITYETIILSEEDQKKIFGKTLTFKNGFVDEPKLDWWNLLETYWVQPLVSIRPSGRESWNEIIAIFAKGFINRDNTRVLDYGYNTEDIKPFFLPFLQKPITMNMKYLKITQGHVPKRYGKKWKNGYTKHTKKGNDKKSIRSINLKRIRFSGSFFVLSLFLTYCFCK